ncbi:pyrrolo-quinoline quinone [Natronococcus pandeyae]|uniref:Pyrrolo-quinoline quinone n=1 Tax=Natronococcus pandeyae TaxID=2055836 RepID=A0A8J8Q4X9_9EURY|nr:PQQ-binding-like beta-propeller repeat protein [Natronococcus pandeyae]TYL38658.1 pyrrolo-quinoline quinone [Natronococcus pandeyae]
MSRWHRRSVLATGAALTTGSVFASLGAGATESDEELPSLGEADGWSSRDGGPRNDRKSATGLEQPETVAWQYERGGRPAIVDGTVYLRTGSELHALDAADGSLQWDRDGLGTHWSEPTVAGESVYVGGDRLRALNADTGEVRWEAEFDSDESVPSPLVAYGTAYLLFEGSLYAFDATDGSRRWKRDSVEAEGYDGEKHPHSFYRRQTGVVATNGAIWASLDAPGGLAELDPLTGKTRWTGRIDVGVDSLAATDETLLVQSSSEESVQIFDIETREIERGISDAYVMSATNRAAVTQGRYAIRRTTLGEETAGDEWSLDGSYAHGAPVIAGDTVVVAHSHSRPGADQREGDRILGIDLEDGSEKWAFELEGDVWSDGADVPFLAVEGETIYTQREDGIVAVRPADDGGDEGEGDDGEDEGKDDDGDESEDDENGDEESDEEAETGDDETDEPAEGDEDEESPGDGDEEPSDDEETTDNTEDGESDDEGPTDDGDEEPSEGEEEPADDDHHADEEDDGEFEGGEDDGETGADEDDGAGGDDATDEDDGDDSTGDDAPADGDGDDPADEDDDETGADAEDDGDDDTDVGGDADDEDGDGETDEADDPADETDDSEGMPGFTTGAGIVGGALGLEWLRRRATEDAPENAE